MHRKEAEDKFDEEDHNKEEDDDDKVFHNEWWTYNHPNCYQVNSSKQAWDGLKESYDLLKLNWIVIVWCCWWCGIGRRGRSCWWFILCWCVFLDIIHSFILVLWMWFLILVIISQRNSSKKSASFMTKKESLNIWCLLIINFFIQILIVKSRKNIHNEIFVAINQLKNKNITLIPYIQWRLQLQCKILKEGANEHQSRRRILNFLTPTQTSTTKWRNSQKKIKSEDCLLGGRIVLWSKTWSTQPHIPWLKRQSEKNIKINNAATIFSWLLLVSKRERKREIFNFKKLLVRGLRKVKGCEWWQKEELIIKIKLI